jgi:heme-degrading monooxygenase HmoA
MGRRPRDPALVIGRVWRGRVKPGLLDEYRAGVASTGLSDYLRTPGNRGGYILTCEHADHGEIIMISFWDDEAAIARFAGDDIARARYYPEDRNYLLEVPERVEHYDAVTLA